MRRVVTTLGTQTKPSVARRVATVSELITMSKFLLLAKIYISQAAGGAQDD